MFLLIFENIGTSELLIVGIVALIFLGPRKLPEMARKIGKIMADFRSTTHEFKSTWEREVNFEEEARAIRSGELDDPPRGNTILAATPAVAAPEIRSIDRDAFEKLAPAAVEDSREKHLDVSPDETAKPAAAAPGDPSDKRTWL